MTFLMFSKFFFVFLLVKSFAESSEDVFMNSTSQPLGIDNEFDGVMNVTNESLGIDNGVNALPGEAQFVVFLYSHRQDGLANICGGTLYKANKVITAAHCVHPETTMFIRYGTHDRLSRINEDVKVIDYVIHPEYTTTTFNNDIAILTLERSIQPRNGVAYAVISHEPVTLHQTVVIYGWGRRSPAERSNSRYLQKAYLKVDYIEYKKIYSSGQRTTACRGDSGGPLVSLDGKLIGVQSCTQVGAPRGGYNLQTKILPFIPWINRYCP